MLSNDASLDKHQPNRTRQRIQRCRLTQTLHFDARGCPEYSKLPKHVAQLGRGGSGRDVTHASFLDVDFVNRPARLLKPEHPRCAFPVQRTENIAQGRELQPTR